MTADTTYGDIIQQYFAALNAGNREEWINCFAPEGGIEDPAGSSPQVGRASLGCLYDAIMGPLARVDFRPMAVHICGNRAAVAWQAALTATNGRGTVCDGIDIFEFNPAGRIFKVTGYWNPEAAFHSLGLT